MARVALDTDVVIAFLDPGDAQHAGAVQALGRHLAGGDEILIGATVYAEVIVRPLQQGTAEKVDEFLAAINAQVIVVDRLLARAAAGLRARHRAVRLPDAIALATALTRDAEFLTLDRDLQRIATKER
ncbi:MAG: type II toxin-antitoxin system VapC family toxin [Solirubrobacteraceae bacterium]